MIVEQIALRTAGLVVVKDNKLLLAYSKNKNAWYLPGGKIDDSESSLEALHREILEELNIELKPERLKYFCHITAPAYGEAPNTIIEQDCFLYELNETIVPSNEIGEVRFFDLEMYKAEASEVSGVLKVFDQLTIGKLLF